MKAIKIYAFSLLCCGIFLKRRPVRGRQIAETGRDNLLAFAFQNVSTFSELARNRHFRVALSIARKCFYGW